MPVITRQCRAGGICESVDYMVHVTVLHYIYTLHTYRKRERTVTTATLIARPQWGANAYAKSYQALGD